MKTRTSFLILLFGVITLSLGAWVYYSKNDSLRPKMNYLKRSCKRQPQLHFMFHFIGGWSCPILVKIGKWKQDQ